jgi:hypothetical protein
VRALARWQRPMAPSESPGVLYRVMCVALHRRIHMAIKTTSELGVFFIIVN